MTLVQLFQFILSISILVILHELGHFIPAKLFKTKVEKFYLFFDPWFSIAKKKIGDTEYGIGWLPFGGYVKIAGMVDESMDTEQLKKPAEPWEFRSKPAWQRLIIMLGGVTVNFFLAWLIYGCLSFFKGETYHDNSKFEYGIAVTPAAEKMGLKNGDKILKIDDKEAPKFETSAINMLFANTVTVDRGGKEVTFPVNEDGVAEILKSNEAKAYFLARTQAVVDTVVANSPAQKAGLLIGDKITAINGNPIQFYDEVGTSIQNFKNKPVEFSVLRNNTTQTLTVTPDKEGKIGFSNFKTLGKVFNASEVNQQFGFFEALGRGLERTIDVLVMQVKQFKIVFNTKTEGYKKVSGPIGIIKQMPETVNWEFFWGFTAMFSVWLAFLNLIPIPGLDGGHVLFTLWEMITGKPVPQKVLENAQMIGVIFLMGLMVLIFGSDIFKLIFK
ncbi:MULTISPECIES: RIP metalloprotease RseP [Amniculibacterium]|jgi:regulator of sigma E protease|uniref:RIP metalloprotease RseP n=1 Tax=Amniculibacterium TaxID=2715289 RepID=UPI000F5ABB68|nr:MULTISPECIES: RIP metalloprotease RseP [Amniculibacterium]